MSIDILLSSNSRSGYSQDVVDLFAKPSGAKHQFRYASKWISAEVLNQISKGAYGQKREAVLCYVDQATKNTPPIVLPVRYATFVEIREHGSTVSIVFKLSDFCKLDDIKAFNSALRSAQPEVPDYKDEQITGKYWLFDDGKAVEKIERSNELSDWERLIAAYYQTPNSIDAMPFYRFEGIVDLETGTTVKPKHNGGELLYTLEGGKKYEVRVYHFHPKDNFPEYALKVSSDDENLVPLNGDSRVLHTRYDRKDYRFKTKQMILGATNYLSFRRTEKDSGKLIWEDFLLGIRINISWKLIVAYVVMIAIGFAAPFIVRTFIDPDKDSPVIIAALVGGLIVGAATLLKEKIRL